MPDRAYQDVPADEMDDHFRAIVREEIASLAGKALRRTQDKQYTRNPERNLAMDVANEEAAQFWGEVLAEYGGVGIDAEGNVIRDDWPVPAEPIAVPEEASDK